MGNNFRVTLFMVIFNFSFTTLITAENSYEIDYSSSGNSVMEVEYEYVNVSVLDTIQDISPYSWKITQGINGSDWFGYFENITNIPPDDVDYREIPPYDVRFPEDFVKEDFLVKSTAVGIWMMVHADFPPKYPDYGASVNLSGHHSKPEFNRVNITCYLGGDSSLTVTLFNSSNSNETYTFHNNQSSKKENWDHFPIESSFLAHRLITEFRADGNSSFIMVENIIVGKYAPKVTTTKRPRTTRLSSTSISSKPGDGSSTTEVASNYAFHTTTNLTIYSILIFVQWLLHQYC